MLKPYVIYKINNINEKNNLIVKYASLVSNDKMLAKTIKLIKINGTKIYGVKFNPDMKCGHLIYKSKDGFYGLWKNNLNNSIYLLVYVDYGDVELSIKKWVN